MLNRNTWCIRFIWSNIIAPKLLTPGHLNVSSYRNSDDPNQWKCPWKKMCSWTQLMSFSYPLQLQLVFQEWGKMDIKHTHTYTHSFYTLFKYYFHRNIQFQLFDVVNLTNVSSLLLLQKLAMVWYGKMHMVKHNIYEPSLYGRLTNLFNDNSHDNCFAYISLTSWFLPQCFLPQWFRLHSNTINFQCFSHSENISLLWTNAEMHFCSVLDFMIEPWLNS